MYVYVYVGCEEEQCHNKLNSTVACCLIRICGGPHIYSAGGAGAGAGAGEPKLKEAPSVGAPKLKGVLSEPMLSEPSLSAAASVLSVVSALKLNTLSAVVDAAAAEPVDAIALPFAFPFALAFPFGFALALPLLLVPLTPLVASGAALATTSRLKVLDTS